MTARYLALGDSYTFGEGVSPAETWPVRLAALLRGRAVEIEDPVIVAATGWTTDELLGALRAAPPRGPFQLVSLLIGVNDQYRGRSRASYDAGFRALLDCAVAAAGGEARRVLVLSIPDWSVTPFAAGRDRARIAREIDELNAVGRSAARLAGSRFVDITAASRAARQPALFAADGLHPSGPAYESWARLALPEAWAALGMAGSGAP